APPTAATPSTAPIPASNPRRDTPRAGGGGTGNVAGSGRSAATAGGSQPGPNGAGGRRSASCAAVGRVAGSRRRHSASEDADRPGERAGLGLRGADPAQQRDRAPLAERPGPGRRPH